MHALYTCMHQVLIQEANKVNEVINLNNNNVSESEIDFENERPHQSTIPQISTLKVQSGLQA